MCKILIILLLLCMHMPAYATTTGWRIYIRSAVIVHGEKIHLKDIADIRGTLPIEQKNKIENTILWDSPTRLGKIKSITPVTIRKKMKEILGAEEIFCIYPNTLSVQRGGSILTKKDLEEKTKEILLPLLQKKYKGKITLTEFRIPEYIFTEDSSKDISIIPQKLQSGRNTAHIESTNRNSKRQKIATISFTVNVYAKLQCVTENIARHTALKSKTKECVKNLALVSKKVWNAKNPELFRAKYTLAKGDVLYENMIEKIPTISKGDTITLVYKNAGIVLHTQVSALADANKGEIIPVQTMQSKKINATVLNKSTVQINK